ncbi:MAG: hypothetical protein JRJ60_12860 [Deltaproteobacteria bacterium]|nr:hypothetical protein [Deltaproteobacteria bacterium]
MIEGLAAKLGYAAISVRRFLKEIGYFRSYTHNGKWYTLHSIPVFNAQGIWPHEELRFSKHGNLIQTINHLVRKSPTGLSAKDLVDMLHHPCHTVLTNLHKTGQLARMKAGPEFVYLSTVSKENLRQRERLQLRMLREAAQPLTAEAAICVLVEFIHHPSSSFEDLVGILRKRRKTVVLPETIELFFREHHIKKTRGSQGSRL